MYERAEGLARVIEDDGQRFAVLQLLYSHCTAKADHARSDPLGAELVAWPTPSPRRGRGSWPTRGSGAISP